MDSNKDKLHFFQFIVIPSLLAILAISLLFLVTSCAEFKAAKSLATEAITVPVKLKYQKTILKLEREVSQLQGELDAASTTQKARIKKKLTALQDRLAAQKRELKQYVESTP